MTNELIPSGELKGIEAAIQSMDDYELQLVSLKARASEVQVTDETSYQSMAAVLNEVKAVEKLGAAAMSPFDVIVSRVKDFLQARKLRVKNTCEEVRGICNLRMGDYTRRKEREDREREARERKELEERLAKENAAVVKDAYKEGEMTKRQAQKAIAEGEKNAAAAAANAAFAPSVGPTAGVRRRINYKAQCTDREKFVRAAFEEWKKLGKPGPLASFLTVSDNKLAEFARDTQDNAKVEALCPGAVKAWDERSF
jgi:hypothetical protein